MPKIRVEYEVPEGGCIKCLYNRYNGRDLICIMFYALLLEDQDGKYQRCQHCIDAEVKTSIPELSKEEISQTFSEIGTLTFK